MPTRRVQCKVHGSWNVVQLHQAGDSSKLELSVTNDDLRANVDERGSGAVLLELRDVKKVAISEISQTQRYPKLLQLFDGTTVAFEAAKRSEQGEIFLRHPRLRRAKPGQRVERPISERD